MDCRESNGYVTDDVIGLAIDHSLPPYWRSFGTKPLSPAVFEILASESIGVTTLTFQDHVTSSVTYWTRNRSFPVGGPLDPSLYL